jgi:hypothetical protein
MAVGPVTQMISCRRLQGLGASQILLPKPTRSRRPVFAAVEYLVDPAERLTDKNQPSPYLRVSRIARRSKDLN